MSTYSTATAAARLAAIGISASTVKNYSDDSRIQPLLSDDAHPGPGKRRRFCDTDLSIIGDIYRLVRSGASIEDATEQVRAGVSLETPPEVSIPADNSQPQPATTALTGPGDTPQPEPIPTNTAAIIRLVAEAVGNSQAGLIQRIVELERANVELEVENRHLREQLSQAQARRHWWQFLKH